MRETHVPDWPADIYGMNKTLSKKSVQTLRKNVNTCTAEGTVAISVSCTIPQEKIQTCLVA